MQILVVAGLVVCGAGMVCGAVATPAGCCVGGGNGSGVATGLINMVIPTALSPTQIAGTATVPVNFVVSGPSPTPSAWVLVGSKADPEA
jgi:hypothetical protein